MHSISRIQQTNGLIVKDMTSRTDAKAPIRITVASLTNPSSDPSDYGDWENGTAKAKSANSMQAWADENTNPTRKRGLETFPRLRVGLVEKPLINWNTRFSSAQCISQMRQPAKGSLTGRHAVFGTSCTTSRLCVLLISPVPVTYTTRSPASSIPRWTAH